MLTVDQILAAQRAQVETLFNLTNTAFAGVEKLVDLNITAAKAALSDAAEQASTVLSAKDAQELVAMQATLLQPLAEKTASYSRHLYEIASQTGADLTKQFEAQNSQVQQKVMGMVDNAAQNAPAGSEAAVAMMKSTIAAASNANQQAIGGSQGLQIKLHGCIFNTRMRIREGFQFPIMSCRHCADSLRMKMLQNRHGQGSTLFRISSCADLINQHQTIRRHL